MQAKFLHKIGMNNIDFVASCAFAVAVAHDRVIFLSESRTEVRTGPLYVALTEVIMAGESGSRLWERVGPLASDQEIQVAVADLLEIGFIRDTVPVETPNQEAWWESVPAVCRRLPVAFRSICSPGEEAVTRALASVGLLTDEKAPMMVVISDDYLHPELAAINRELRPWLLSKPIGHTIFIGPVFLPGQTVCWACLAWWMKAHRWRQHAFFGADGKEGPLQPSFAHTPATLALAAGMVASATAVLASTGDYPNLRNAVLSFDTRTCQQVRHRLRPAPGCRVCETLPASHATPPLRNLVSNVIGLVSHLSTTDESCHGLHQSRAKLVFPLPQKPSKTVLLPIVVYGKGRTVEEAEQSCLGEAVERYSYAYQATEPVRLAQQSGPASIAPEKLLLFSDRQFEQRLAWNAVRPDRHWIPEYFDCSSEIDWSPVQSLVTGEIRYVPAAMVYFNYPLQTENQFCVADSNGCAAGISRDGAILSALLELIERDSLALWWYNRLQRPEVDLSTIGSERVHAVTDAIRAGGRIASVIELTSDLGIPSYVAVLPLRDGYSPIFGAAAHVRPEVAVYKALAEASQILHWTQRTPTQDSFTDWLATASILQPEYEYFQPLGLSTPPSDGPTNTSAAIQYCLDRLQRAGLEAYWIDLTRPETRVPAVRVIVPGLRHMWPRYAPGRLYDVPVQLGWLDRPTPEEDLNPIGCML